MDHVDATHVRGAGGRDDARGEHARRRRLARAVRSEQPEDLTAFDREIEGVDCADVTRIHLGETARHDRGIDALRRRSTQVASLSSCTPCGLLARAVGHAGEMVEEFVQRVLHDGGFTLADHPADLLVASPHDDADRLDARGDRPQ